MYCKKCGSNMPESALFCSRCGVPLEKTRDEEDFDLEEEKEEYTGSQPENNISEEDDLGTPSWDINTAGKDVEGRKIRIKPILWISAGVLLIGVLLAGLLIPGFRCFMERTFLPSKVVMANAYSHSVNKVFDSGMPASELTGDMAAEYEARLTVGESSLSVLSMFMGVDAEDILALSDITVTCDATRQGNLLRTVYDVALRNTSVLTAEQYVDQSNGDLWLALPELNDQPLYIALSDSIDPTQKLDQTVLAAIQAEPDLLKEMTLRYMEMLMDSFESIEKNSKAVKLNGLTERMTVLEAYTNEIELHNTLINILEEMLTDDDIQSILDSSTDPNAATQFKTDVQQMIDEMKDSSVELNADHSYTLYTYLNNRNEIVGIRLEYASDEGTHDICSFLKVSMGDDYAAEYALFEDIIINGKGTVGEQTSGNYKVLVSGTEMCQLELSDWKYSAEGINGTLRIIPSDHLLDAFLAQADMDQSLGMFSSMLDISLVVDLNYRHDQAFADVSVQAGSTDVIGVSLTYAQKQAQSIQLPADYIKTDESGVLQWISGVDESAIQSLMNRLAQAGLSEELLPDMNELFSEETEAEPLETTE